MTNSKSHGAGRNNTVPAEPAFECALCPRLVDFREDNRALYPDWFNGPVPSFGKTSAEMLIVGLAPGLKGANKTGRPFTGDFAGDLLYETLIAFGFARGRYQARPDDGLTLVNCMITNAVRCVPPQNKPTGREATSCRQFLSARIRSLKKLKVIIVLGRVAHDSTLTALDLKKSLYPFAHNSVHNVQLSAARELKLIDSYHCSRYNTNTGRLTPEMFNAVFQSATSELKKA